MSDVRGEPGQERQMTALERLREHWMINHPDISYMSLTEDCGADGPRFSVSIKAGGDMQHLHNLPDLNPTIHECYRRALFSRDAIAREREIVTLGSAGD